MQTVLNIRQRNTAQKGSLLLELLVAFTIISLTMTVVVESFLTSQRSYRTTAAEADLVRAMTFLLEDMTREARVSKDFGCGAAASDCSGSSLSMTRVKGINSQPSDEQVVYSLVSNIVQKNVALNPGNVPITPKSITVTAFRVQAFAKPNRVLVSITAKSTDEPDTQVTIQTTLTKRPYI